MGFYKGLTHRTLAATVQVAPYTAAMIQPVLEWSAKAAVAACSGGDNGRMCSLAWADGGKADKKPMAGSQLSVLGALVSIMQTQATANTTSSSGGSGDATTSGSGSGTGSSSTPTPTGNGHSAGASIGISFTALAGGLLTTHLFGQGATHHF
jgi:mannan endo-1,6-alpha-mannosidase